MISRLFPFLVCFTFALSLPLFAQQGDGIEEGLFYRVEIHIDRPGLVGEIADMEVAIDHVHFTEEGNILTEISGFELKMLRDAGIGFTVIVEDVATFYEERIRESAALYDAETLLAGAPENFELGSFAGHLSFDEAVETLDRMHQKFPELISEKFSIGQTIEGREIWAVWMGTERHQTKPQALYTSLLHAREPNSLTALIYYMWWLLENHGTDATATAILENRHLAFVPIVNPDGYEFNRMNNPNGGGMHRKNRRPVGTSNQGVDLNRNFGPMIFWDHPNGGSSTIINSDVYRGEAPFSEPETAALRDFVKANDFRAAFNYHTFSNLLIYPYGALQRETQDSPIFRAYAAEMTRYNQYRTGTDFQTVGYNTRGNSDDWMYGLEDGNPDGRKNIIAMTPEVGTSADFFWPPIHRIIPLSEENLHPNIKLAEYTGPYLNWQIPAKPETNISWLSLQSENALTFRLDGLHNMGRTILTDANLVLDVYHNGQFYYSMDAHIPDLGVNESYSSVEGTFFVDIPAQARFDDNIELRLRFDGQYLFNSPEWTYNMRVSDLPHHGEIPGLFALYQNYPNPFNPGTAIRFVLNESADVRLDIYDALGRRVQTPVNGTLERGKHRVNFDGSALSSGVYVYRISVNGMIETRKMTLLK